MFPTREYISKAIVSFIFFILAMPAFAQQKSTSQSRSATIDVNDPSTIVAVIDEVPNVLANGRGTWELGAFLGGGTGAGKSSDTQFFYAGGRAGLVLTPDLFTSTPIRGNLEYAIEVMPVYTVFTPNGAVYGASIKPFLVQWNFTKPQRLVPFVHIAGGVLFTTSDVPPPDTSSINFTPQIGGGVHWFHRPDRSIDFSMDLVHHSNASLGDHNPGYNASVFFTLGYSWYKPRH